MIHRQYGRSSRGISVLGIDSLVDWDDCLATIVYRQKGNRTMSLTATSTFFVVGSSSPFARLYHTSICHEFGTLHHGESVKVIKFSLASQWIATSGNKKIYLWNTAAKLRVNKWEDLNEVSPSSFIALGFDLLTKLGIRQL